MASKCQKLAQAQHTTSQLGWESTNKKNKKTQKNNSGSPPGAKVPGLGPPGTFSGVSVPHLWPFQAVPGPFFGVLSYLIKVSYNAPTKHQRRTNSGAVFVFYRANVPGKIPPRSRSRPCFRSGVPLFLSLIRSDCLKLSGIVPRVFVRGVRWCHFRGDLWTCGKFGKWAEVFHFGPPP